MDENINSCCNLCLKSFPDELFLNHLSSMHFPQSKLICMHCNGCFTSSEILHNHYNSEHDIICETLNLDVFKFDKVFVSRSDVIHHAQNSIDRIKQAFPLDSSNINTRTETQTLTPNCTGIDASTCEFCEKYEATVCYYCVATFPNICHLKQHLLNVHLQLSNNVESFACQVFPNDDQLKKHRNGKHGLPQHQNVEARNELDNRFKKNKYSTNCIYCNKTLANNSNLKRHLVNTHADLLGTIPARKSEYTCDYCKCHFSNKSSIKRHIENFHIKERETKKNISCFLCEQRFNSIKNMNSHLTTEHRISIQEDKIKFSQLDAFWKWKQEEELRTNSRYIQLRGLRRQQRKGEEISTLKFVCNRSGIFHSKSNGKRAYRIKGSSKIGRYCSAYIEITYTDSAVECTYCCTHSGHENDLRYLTLTLNEKKEIYDKIKNGASFSSILNEIRDNVGKEITRKHLVTNKDLHNIVTTFKKLPKTSTVFNPQNLNIADACIADCTVETETQNSLNHDLEISADLWVETCERIVNQFDSSISLIQSRDDPSISQNLNASEQSEVVRDESNNSSYGNTGYVTDETLMNTDGSWNKFVNFSAATYVPVANERKETYVECDSDEVQLRRRIDLHDYCVQSTTFPTINVGNANNEHVVTSHVNSFVPTNTVVNTVVHNGVSKCQIPISQGEARTTSSTIISKTADNNIGTLDTEEEVSPKLGETDTKVSDLRDRVNSVTALYNIVESELDERKKKIIRNYVDNMFKVLQYRYNKCVSKKNTTKRPSRRRSTSKGKQLNTRRRGSRGDNVINKRAPRIPKPKHRSQSYTCSSMYITASKNDNSYQNAASNLMVTNVIPESIVSRWEY